jgi:hypothetical protein
VDLFGSQFVTHVAIFLSGSTFIGILGHAVNTFPMPKSAIGRWFLGVIQYAVGQRMQSTFTLNGGGSAQAAMDTAVSKVTAKVADAVVKDNIGPLK